MWPVKITIPRAIAYMDCLVIQEMKKALGKRNDTTAINLRQTMFHYFVVLSL